MRTMQRILASLVAGWHDGQKPQVLTQQASEAQLQPRWLGSYCWRRRMFSDSKLEKPEWREKPEKLLEAEQDTDITGNLFLTILKKK